MTKTQLLNIFQSHVSLFQAVFAKTDINQSDYKPQWFVALCDVVNASPNIAVTVTRPYTYCAVAVAD